jgi:acyl carrier protein
VDLAEVELLLRQHPAVKDAAVVAKKCIVGKSSQNITSEQRLVAFVVAEKDHQCSIDEIRCFLSAKLPDYMIPSHFMFLDRLPLNPNGKVAYLALPSMDQILSRLEDVSSTSWTDLEQAIGGIFAEVLGLERVGLHDHFFRLGGHSLLAAQAASRIRETLGVALALRTFLEAPTVASLANEVQALIQTHGMLAAQAGEREEIEL